MLEEGGLAGAGVALDDDAAALFDESFEGLAVFHALAARRDVEAVDFEALGLAVTDLEAADVDVAGRFAEFVEVGCGAEGLGVGAAHVGPAAEFNAVGGEEAGDDGTFLPWQMWRFVWINLKMIGIIRRSHH